ncbi:MAG: oligosaccharide flippase family protein [Calditerrivibrio sp.]|nr:oligosaccharide flippase family protein [Calditerrivibrio sp.]
MLTLFSGTILSQFILLVVSPVLTRVYKPEDFGEYAFYLAVVTVLSVVVTGRYDLAVMIAENDEQSEAVALLSIFLSLLSGVFILVLGVVFVFAGFLKDFISLIVLGSIHLFFIGFYNTLYHRLNRAGHFKMISVVAVAQSMVIVVYQMLAGFLKPNSFNLILGSLLGVVVADIIILLKDSNVVGILRYKKELKTVALRYINFPKYDMWAGLFNTGFQQVPVMLVSSFFGAINAGFFSLTQRMLQMPVSLIAGSVLGAFRQKAIDEFKEKGECRDIFIKVLRFMAVVALLPTLIILFFGEEIFGFVFGNDWRISGFFAQILVISFFVRFITSPLTYMFYIAEKQHWNLLGQIAFILVTLGSFYIGDQKNSVKLALYLYTISLSVIYLIYLYLSYLFSKGMYVNKR